MARVLFVPLPEFGHIVPTLGLARSLRRRGHDVLYAVPWDCVSLVRSRGFEAAPFWQGIYPAGWFDATRRNDTDWRYRWLRAEHAMRGFSLLGSLPSRVLEHQPDVVIGDTFRPEAALAAYSQGIPSFLSNVVPTLGTVYGRPPPTSFYDSNDLVHLQRETMQHVFACGAAPWRPGLWAHDWALRFGIDPRTVSLESDTVPLFRALPEINFSPAAFEMVEGTPALLRYVPDRDFEAEPAPTPELSEFVDGTDLLFLSMGSQAFRYPHVAENVRALVEALRARPHIRGVIALGKEGLENHRIEDVPSNVMLVGFAPQLWLLERATVFVTHGGMSSVRESVEACVPMLVIPHDYDQPGNAARVEHFGIGLKIHPVLATAEVVGRCIDELFAERSRFSECLRRLRDRLVIERQSNSGTVDAVERLAARGRGPRRAALASEDLELPRSSALGWLWIAPDGEPFGGRIPQPGDCVRWDGVDSPALGRHGFSALLDPDEGLGHAVGGWLARVEISGDLERSYPFVSGRELKVRWVIDASEALEDFIEYCVSAAFQVGRSQDRAVVALLRTMVKRARHLRSVESDPLKVESELHAAIGQFTFLKATSWLSGNLVAMDTINFMRYGAAAAARDAYLRLYRRIHYGDHAPDLARSSEVEVMVEAEIRRLRRILVRMFVLCALERYPSDQIEPELVDLATQSQSCPSSDI